jgi:hypothetical protein
MLEADFNGQAGKKDQAVALVGQAESAASDDPNCLRSVMLAYEMLGQPAEAAPSIPLTRHWRGLHTIWRSEPCAPQHPVPIVRPPSRDEAGK